MLIPWGFVFGLWGFFCFLDFIFSKNENDSDEGNSGLTKEQKIDLYTEREDGGQHGNMKYEIRKSGNNRIIILEQNGKKVYIPVEE